MTVRKREGTGSIRLHSVENSLWKRLRTSRKTVHDDDDDDDGGGGGGGGVGGGTKDSGPQSIVDLLTSQSVNYM